MEQNQHEINGEQVDKAEPNMPADHPDANSESVSVASVVVAGARQRRKLRAKVVTSSNESGADNAMPNDGHIANTSSPKQNCSKTSSSSNMGTENNAEHSLLLSNSKQTNTSSHSNNEDEMQTHALASKFSGSEETPMEREEVLSGDLFTTNNSNTEVPLTLNIPRLRLSEPEEGHMAGQDGSDINDGPGDLRATVNYYH